MYVQQSVMASYSNTWMLYTQHSGLFTRGTFSRIALFQLFKGNFSQNVKSILVITICSKRFKDKFFTKLWQLIHEICENVCPQKTGYML